MTYDAEGEIGTGKGTISMRALLHLDADAFFASVEQALDPRLRGRPVIVGGSYRGVVSSASYEARKFGVHSAMPIARAEQLCPNAVFLHGQYSQYEEYSDELFSICRQYAPEVEQSSIDEGVLDLTGTERYHRGATRRSRVTFRRRSGNDWRSQYPKGLRPIRLSPKLRLTSRSRMAWSRSHAGPSASFWLHST